MQKMTFRYRRNFNKALRMLGIYARQGVPDCLTAIIDEREMSITFPNRQSEAS